MHIERSLLDKFRESIRNFNMLEKGDTLVLGVSGGLDSMVLLHLFGQIRAEWRLSLVIAHVNHGLRPEESEREENLVRRAAEGSDLPFRSCRLCLNEKLESLRPSVENHARDFRHRFLMETARQVASRKIVLAHHLDDQIELFFMRLLRGAGVKGIAGMKPISKSPADSGTFLLRPLLHVAKIELGRYAERFQVGFREDASNADARFERNHWRHEILPHLDRFGKPGWKTRVGRFMELMAYQDEWVESMILAWEGNGKRPRFDSMPMGFKTALIHRQLNTLAIPASYDLVRALIREPSVPQTVSPGREVRRLKDGSLEVSRADIESRPPGDLDLPESPIFLRAHCDSIRAGNLIIEWERTDQPGLEGIEKKPSFCEYFDYDKIMQPIQLRHWVPGDRFKPLGMSGRIKLQDLFTNARIPRLERGGIVLGLDASGEIFWVEGFPVGDGFKLDKSTLRRLKWCWNRLGSAVSP